MSEINNLCKSIYQDNVKKGWYEEPRSNGEIIALIHSELSEALEADRKPDKPQLGRRVVNDVLMTPNEEEFKHDFLQYVKDSYWDEMADAVIRIFDHAGHNNIDLESHILAKLRYNRARAHKHGNKKY